MKKELAKKKIIPDKSPEVVFQELQKNELKFDWLGLKGDVKSMIGNNSNSFKVNIRIRKDSLIWISISSIVGVEGARVEITPDTIRLMDKINSVYYISDIDSLSEKFDVDADFETLQSLIVGNSINLKDSGNLKISVQKGDYLLSTFKKRILKKLIRKNEKLEKKNEKLDKKSALTDVERKSEKYERKYEKIEKEEEKYDMILQSMWVDPDIFKITKIAINDLKTNHSLIAEYSNFFEQEGQRISHQARFHSESKRVMEISVEYTKISLNVPQTVPFNIPEKYERKY